MSAQDKPRFAWQWTVTGEVAPVGYTDTDTGWVAYDGGFAHPKGADLAFWSLRDGGMLVVDGEPSDRHDDLAKAVQAALLAGVPESGKWLYDHHPYRKWLRLDELPKPSDLPDMTAVVTVWQNGETSLKFLRGPIYTMWDKGARYVMLLPPYPGAAEIDQAKRRVSDAQAELDRALTDLRKLQAEV